MAYNQTNTQSRVIPHTHVKADITDFPTKVSDFTNDAGYIDNTVSNLVNYDTSTEVDSKINTAVSSAYKFKGYANKVEDLPLTGNKVGDLYSVNEGHDGIAAGTDWAWDGEKWQPTAGRVDLSNYYTKDEIDERVADAAYTKTEINTMSGLSDATAGFSAVDVTVDNVTKQATATDANNQTIDGAFDKDAESIKNLTGAYNALETRVDTAESAIANIDDAVAESFYTKEEVNLMTGKSSAEKTFTSSLIGSNDVRADGTINPATAVQLDIDTAFDNQKNSLTTVVGAINTLVSRVASLESGDDEKTKFFVVTVNGSEVELEDSFITDTTVLVPTYQSEPNGYIRTYVDNGKLKVTSTATESNLTINLVAIKAPSAS